MLCYPNIYRCIQCLSWHCQSVLILWHFDCSLHFFNFSLRGTKIHPRLKNLHFWDQLKAEFSSNICPDCIFCHLEFQNFPFPNTRGGYAGGMSSLCLLPKILHLLKNFLRTLYTIIEIMDSTIAGSMIDCYSRK